MEGPFAAAESGFTREGYFRTGRGASRETDRTAAPIGGSRAGSSECIAGILTGRVARLRRLSSAKTNRAGSWHLFWRASNG